MDQIVGLVVPNAYAGHETPDGGHIVIDDRPNQIPLRELPERSDMSRIRPAGVIRQ